MKNKYQEALNVLSQFEKPNAEEFGKEFVKVNTNLLQELVDKETPRKVVFESNGFVIKTARCPKCNGIIHFGFETYCYYCGTKISWE